MAVVQVPMNLVRYISTVTPTDLARLKAKNNSSTLYCRQEYKQISVVKLVNTTV